MGYLREATEDDIDLLFEWANETGVRKNSFSEKAITYKEHIEWFKNLQSKEHVKQFIFICHGQPAGQIRITIDSDEAEIAYSIRAEKRHMGLGKEMLALLALQVKQEYPEVKKLTAKVKPDNLASQQAFLGMGYEQKYYAYEIEVDKAVKIK